MGLHVGVVDQRCHAREVGCRQTGACPEVPRSAAVEPYVAISREGVVVQGVGAVPKHAVRKGIGVVASHGARPMAEVGHVAIGRIRTAVVQVPRIVPVVVVLHRPRDQEAGPARRSLASTVTRTRVAGREGEEGALVGHHRGNEVGKPRTPLPAAPVGGPPAVAGQVGFVAGVRDSIISFRHEDQGGPEAT